MKIGIVGAGWYGCHLAAVLRARGAEVDLFEAAEDVLQLASVNNQARLHTGYHYPRCARTRLQTVDCFPRFMGAYPDFTKPIENNIYTISRENSLIDFVTYCQIMRASGLHFQMVDPHEYGIANVDGAIKTQERQMDFDAARAGFREILGSALHLGHRVASIQDAPDGAWIDGKKYDYVVNCTWCALTQEGHEKPDNLFFEPTILLYYRAKTPFYGALTVMDGPCFSIYPYKDDCYTLSHVAFTALGKFKTFEEAQAFNDALDQADILRVRQSMTREALKEFPAFFDYFEYMGPQFSVKTKYENKCASRDTSVTQRGHIFNVFSGKIDTIFIAEDLILRRLGLAQEDTETQQEAVIIPLRQARAP